MRAFHILVFKVEKVRDYRGIQSTRQSRLSRNPVSLHVEVDEFVMRTKKVCVECTTREHPLKVTEKWVRNKEK